MYTIIGTLACFAACSLFLIWDIRLDRRLEKLENEINVMEHCPQEEKDARSEDGRSEKVRGT